MATRDVYHQLVRQWYAVTLAQETFDQLGKVELANELKAMALKLEPQVLAAQRVHCAEMDRASLDFALEVQC